jgi:hypothetical protein
MKKLNQITFLGLLTSFLLFQNCKQSSDFEYTIISDKKLDEREQCQVDILIPNKMKEKALLKLVQELDEKRKDCPKTFMTFYYGFNVENVQHEDIYATADNALSKKDYSLNIIKATYSEEKLQDSLSEVQIGTLIGKWKEDYKINAVLVLTENKGKYTITRIYKNGQTTHDNVVKTKKGDNVIYRDPTNGHGEYYIVNTQMLFFMNKENKEFSKALPHRTKKDFYK